MDEETSKIKQHIDTEREELWRNLDEIEYRVKSATDLRAHFNKNTGLILGAAVAGGFLLSLAFRKSSNSDSNQGEESTSTTTLKANTLAQPTLVSKHLHRFSETIDNIFDGLVGVACGKLQSFAADVVPGLQAKHDGNDEGRSPVDYMKSSFGDPSELRSVK